MRTGGKYILQRPKSPKAERGAAPNVSQWLKLSHAEGTCDVYAFADLGWRALLPHLYP